MLEERIVAFFQEESIPASSTFLLAVSGGIDSMVLAHLFLSSELDFQVAHMNFCLRDSDSDADERLVLEWCDVHDVEVHTQKVDTKTYALDQKMSVQEAARELRYRWFAELQKDHDLDYTVTAHHLDDDIETFFLHLSRKSGISGLRAIPQRNGSVLRPLLKVPKHELIKYANANGVPFREDKSNQKLDYTRNHWRHEILYPLSVKMENYHDSFVGTLGHLKAENILLKELIDHQFLDGPIRMDVINSFSSPSTLLFHLLRPYGFSYSQCHQLSKSLDSVGAVFLSPSHRLLVDRHELIIEAKEDKNTGEEIEITTSEDKVYLDDGVLIFSEAPFEKQIETTIGIDHEKINWPLRIRYWKQGDFFHPKGMVGKRQKLKKYFTNNKIDRFTKQRIKLLVDDNDNVLWIIGHRQDDRFTGSNLFITFIPNLDTKPASEISKM